MRQVITRAQLVAVVDEMVETYGAQVGETDDVIRTDYSGRGMRVSSCVGFVLPWECVLPLGAALATVLGNEDLWDARDLLHLMMRTASIDDMARQIIVYFPGVTLANEED